MTPARRAGRGSAMGERERMLSEGEKKKGFGK